jgi:hypothetical protein
MICNRTNNLKYNNYDEKRQRNLCKKEYVPPVLMAIFIEMECGIAANSATLNPGDTNTPATPGIGD